MGQPISGYLCCGSSTVSPPPSIECSTAPKVLYPPPPQTHISGSLAHNASPPAKNISQRQGEEAMTSENSHQTDESSGAKLQTVICFVFHRRLGGSKSVKQPRVSVHLQEKRVSFVFLDVLTRKMRGVKTAPSDERPLPQARMHVIPAKASSGRPVMPADGPWCSTAD